MSTTQWLVWNLGSRLPCCSVLKVFGIRISIRFMCVVCGEPRGSSKTLQVTFLSSSFSIISLILTFRFPGAPFLSLSTRELCHYLSCSATDFLWLCSHLGPSSGKTEREKYKWNSPQPSCDYNSSQSKQKFMPPSLRVLGACRPLLFSHYYHSCSYHGITWGQGFKITEKRLRNTGGLLHSWVFGVPFPPTQARSRRPLLELSLNTLMATFGFVADLSPDQEILEEKC